MKKVSLLASASASGIIAATMIAAPAFACHPVGGIIKQVQDQTTSGAISDANTSADAISVNSGDTLLYTITVKNTGASASNGDNDMLNTTLTDTLPAGLQMAEPGVTGNAISENLGTIAPGKSITKTYHVKVTSTTDGDVITNKACFNGKSKDNKANQQDCDMAVVKVTAPTTPTTPITPTTPTTPVTPSTPATPVQTPAALPDTGSTALTATLFVAVTAGLGYAVNMLRLKKQRA